MSRVGQSGSDAHGLWGRFGAVPNVGATITDTGVQTETALKGAVQGVKVGLPG